MDQATVGFQIVDTTIDPLQLKQQLRHDQCGGFVSFEGWVRNHNESKQVDYLVYETYLALATSEGARIVALAKTQFAIEDAYCVHRIGTLHIGDMAVWVGVSAAHRDAAFAACRFIIDTIKQHVPIWKQEYYLNDTAQPTVSPQWLQNRV